MFNQLLTKSPDEPRVPVTDGGSLNKVRQLIHQRLIDSIETDGLGVLSNPENIKAQIRWLISELEDKRGVDFNSWEKRQLESEILVELDGMGPLASLMIDSTISDILVNGPSEIWVDRQGELQKTDIQFDDHAHVRRFLDRLLASQGRALDSSNPMVDAKLADGSRVHAVVPPLCSLGAVISIRRFQHHSQSIESLIEQDFMSKGMLALLSSAVESGMNLVIAGGASAGKTTLINHLSAYIPDNERVITIEETAELKLQNAHTIPLEGRTANMEGRGGVSLRELLKTALRMRADRIIVGEVRGVEVFDMLQAMNIGHDGSMTTVHANSPADVLSRLEMLALAGDNGLTRDSVRGMIGSAIQLIVQLTRYSDGKRRVSSICEVVSEEGTLVTRELFAVKGKGSFNPRPAKEYLSSQLQFASKIEQRGFDSSGLKSILEADAPE